MRKLTRENLLDIIYGGAILGTGGGGSLDEGLAKIDEALSLGKEFMLADFSEMNSDDIVGTPYACGAISPLTEEASLSASWAAKPAPLSPLSSERAIPPQRSTWAP